MTGTVLATRTAAETTVTGGEGDDTFEFSGVAIGDRGVAIIDAGTGNDTLTFADGTGIGADPGTSGSGAVLGGAGMDLFLFDSSGPASSLTGIGAVGSGTLDMGDDDDTLISLGDSVLAIGRLDDADGTLLGGDGADEVRFEGATLGGNGRLLGEGGDDTLDFSLASTLADGAGLEAGDGNDRVRIEDSTSIGATAMLDGGADNDTLELFGSATGTFDGDGVITSFETLQKTGTGTWNWDHAGAVFNTILLDEGTFTLLDETRGGATTIAAAATLSGVGTLVGPLSNAGRLVPGDDGIFGVLTIDGDCSGGGLLALDVMLGADGSPADLLRITGTTGGSTTVQAGFDGGVRGLLTGDDLLLAGVFATMTQARAEVHGTATEFDLEGWGGGLYASYLWQGLYLDAVLKGDVFDLDYSIPAIEAAASLQALALGASLEVGWRFEVGSSLQVQGGLRLSW